MGGYIGPSQWIVPRQWIVVDASSMEPERPWLGSFAAGGPHVARFFELRKCTRWERLLGQSDVVADRNGVAPFDHESV